MKTLHAAHLYIIQKNYPFPYCCLLLPRNNAGNKKFIDNQLFTKIVAFLLTPCFGNKRKQYFHQAYFLIYNHTNTEIFGRVAITTYLLYLTYVTKYLLHEKTATLYNIALLPASKPGTNPTYHLYQYGRYCGGDV